MRRIALLLLLALGASTTLHAAVGTIQPPNPTSADVIVIDVSKPYAELQLQPVVINGSQIEITFRGYPTVPAGGGDLVSVGPLPAGLYSIVVHYIIEDGFGNIAFDLTDPPVPLAVSQASIPMLDPRGLTLLVCGLAVIGMTVVTRRLSS